MNWILLGIGAALVIGGIAWARRVTGWQKYAGAGVVLLGMLMAIIVWRLQEPAPPGPAPSEDAALLAQAPTAEPKPARPTEPERKPVAEPPPKPPTLPSGLAQQNPFWVERDGTGGGKITVSVPAANLVRTGLTFRCGEAFYISTPNYVANLQAGIIKKVNGREVVVWAPVSPNEFWSVDQPHRMRLGSAAEAELCFGVTAVPRGTHRIHVRKSAGPVGPVDYTPGVPLDRVLY